MSLWLTRILPDQRHRDSRKDLSAAVHMHHRLMSLFPDHIGDEARAALKILFRVEDGPTGPQILMQSIQPPDLERLPAGYGSTATKPLGPLLDALRPDLPVRYRIAANAIRKPGRTTRELYRLAPVVPLSGVAADEWWTRQAEGAGLKIATLHSTPLDAATGTRRQDNNRIKHVRTQFDGTALITDPALLRARITDGIGKGKAYGCGLLSIAPDRPRL